MLPRHEHLTIYIHVYHYWYHTCVYYTNGITFFHNVCTCRMALVLSTWPVRMVIQRLSSYWYITMLTWTCRPRYFYLLSISIPGMMCLYSVVWLFGMSVSCSPPPLWCQWSFSTDVRLHAQFYKRCVLHVIFVYMLPYFTCIHALPHNWHTHTHPSMPCIDLVLVLGVGVLKGHCHGIKCAESAKKYIYWYAAQLWRAYSVSHVLHAVL